MRDFSLPGRSAVRAGEAALATSHPIANATGLRMLMEGGSAVDAAIAAAAVLTMAEPQMTGIGGDCFALVSCPTESGISAINASGKAPLAISAERFQEMGVTMLDRFSPHAVTIPAAVRGWWALHQRYGKLDWDRLLQPAVEYSRNGIAVHDRTAFDWQGEAENLRRDDDTANLYLHQGKPLQAGMVHVNPALAETYKRIADHGPDGFYKGPVADDLLEKLQSVGGLHSEDDFAAASADFVKPISADYMGHTIWECPPNGQGVAALLMIRIIERFEIAAMGDADRIHLLAEAAKLAYHMRDVFVADPDHADVPVDWMLADTMAEQLAAKIDMGRAARFADSDFPTHPDTIYLAAVDQEGMSVSFINSIFDTFGSCITSPGSGVLLHSRGRSFMLQPGHRNVIAPGKRPMHTIIPAMVTRDNKLLGPFGVMGGQYQAAGHAMLVSNLFSRGMNPQEALDAPRSFSYNGKLEVESGYDAAVAEMLRQRGHDVQYPSNPIGGGQAIMRDHENGCWIAGSDPRKDGMSSGI